MGLGEYLSGVAENDYFHQEKAREVWELDNNPDGQSILHPQHMTWHADWTCAGEIDEMIEIYKERGFSEEEANKIVDIMARHKEFFLDHMMVEVGFAFRLDSTHNSILQELGLLPIDEDESPLKQGLVMFFSFLGFGFVPLFCLCGRVCSHWVQLCRAAYIILSGVNFSGSFDPRFLLACVLTGGALFTLGALKAKFSQVKWWSSGLFMLGLGSVAAGISFLVSFVFVLWFHHALSERADCRIDKIVTVSSNCPATNSTMTTTAAANFTTIAFSTSESAPGST